MGAAPASFAQAKFESSSSEPEEKVDLNFGPDGPKSNEEVHKMFVDAQALEAKYQWAEAAVLMEEAIRQRPRNPAYREALGRELYGQRGAAKNSSDEKVLIDRAHVLFLQARALGDNSNYIQIALEKKRVPMGFHAPTAEAQKMLDTAEVSFSKGDFDSALDLYGRALKLDPQYYEAPLFAGDVLLRQGKFDEAGVWYAKAIAINPNRETAYRYWGDTLMRQGKNDEAKTKFIDGIIAEPYIKASWIGLQQWAAKNGMSIGSPAIKLPQVAPPASAGGNTSITISPGDGGPSGTAWMAYQLIRSGESIPDKKKPAAPHRHSLDDEAAALKAAIEAAKKEDQAKLDVSLRQLIALDADGLLESWIVLNHADRETSQDYPAYREKHRDLLRAYILKYILHPTTAGPAGTGTTGL